MVKKVAPKKVAPKRGFVDKVKKSNALPIVGAVVILIIVYALFFAK